METREGSASTARSDRHSSPPSPSALPTSPEDAISNSKTRSPSPITEPAPSPETHPSPTPPEALSSSNCEPETPTICLEQLQSDSPKAEYPAAVTDREGAETGAQTLDLCEVSRPGVLDASSPGVALLLGEGEGGTDELRGNGHRRAGDIQDSKVLLEEQVQGEEACGSESQPVPASGDLSQAVGQTADWAQCPVQLRAPEGAKRRRAQDCEEDWTRGPKIKRKAHSCPPLPQHSSIKQGRPAGSRGRHPTLPKAPAQSSFLPTPPAVSKRRVQSQPPPKQGTTTARNVIKLPDGSLFYWPGGGAPPPEVIRDLLADNASTAQPSTNYSQTGTSKVEASNGIAEVESPEVEASSPSPSPSPSHSSLSLSASPPPQRA